MESHSETWGAFPLGAERQPHFSHGYPLLRFPELELPCRHPGLALPYLQQATQMRAKKKGIDILEHDLCLEIQTWSQAMSLFLKGKAGHYSL